MYQYNHIVTQEDITSCRMDKRIPAWGYDVYGAFGRDLCSTDTPFPCTFGVDGFKKGYLRYVFIEDATSGDALWSLREALIEYTSVYREISRNTSLVAFFRPDEGDVVVERYRSLFWNVLQFLHWHDPQRWPSSIPTDTDCPLWEFSFNAEPLFVVCNTPVHVARRSRRSKSLTILFQPRWVFEGLEADTPRGRAAREVIRKRLGRYDTLDVDPDLGAYGDPNNREWRQYFLLDSNELQPQKCPLSIESDIHKLQSQKCPLSIESDTAERK